MKLLIVTQTLDSKHSVLGFFVRWVLEFAKQCEQVTVFCLDMGEDVFPENVTVVHIPRTWHGLKTWPITLVYKAFVYRKKYTHVFAHMNPEYIISAGLVWKIFRKKINFWYAHGTVSLRLKIATAFCATVFSSTKEGFRHNTSKICLVGQGIDASLYVGVRVERGLQTPMRLVSIGRTSASKRLELLLETVKLLKNKYNIQTVCTIIGGPVTDKDVEYEKSLKEFVVKNGLEDSVVWTGPLPLIRAIEVLKTQDIFPHFGDTGSLDKAVLDAMMCGVIPLTTNEAVKKILNDISDKNLTIIDSEDAAKRVAQFVHFNEKEVWELRNKITEYTQNNFSLKVFTGTIISKMSYEV